MDLLVKQVQRQRIGARNRRKNRHFRDLNSGPERGRTIDLTSNKKGIQEQTFKVFGPMVDNLK
jgi:hypothetical protein